MFIPAHFPSFLPSSFPPSFHLFSYDNVAIDYLTWGNHEADIPHPDVCKHVRSYKGTFINSNMQDHEAMDAQVPYEVIEITSEDGKQSRKIGFIAVLSDDPKLYSGFKAPGAFGGATIEDPWEILAKYQKELEEEHGCDLVIPLEHLYVHENTKTTEMFDFPVILSGHDHHRIDQMINGTRVIKPGMDGVFATVLEVVWDANSTKPRIRSNFVEVSKFEPCPALKAKTDAAYDVLDPLRNTMLAGILPQFRPLTSKNARGSVCTMGKLVCSMIRQSLLQTQGALNQVDAVILMGGNIRGNEDYPDDSFFSLETLEAEVKSDEVIGIVDMPGHVMAAGIESTHAGDPKPGWFQYDDGIKEENGRVTTVAGIPIQPDRIYRVATKIKDLTNGQSPPMKEYYEANPDLLPSKGSYVNIHSELMGFFARNLFRKLWDATGELIGDPADALEEASQPANLERIEGKLRLSVLDRDGDGYLTIDDIHYALRDFLGLSVDDNYKTLAEAIHSYADVTGTGKVTVEDFEAFCTDMPRNLELQAKWEEAFPDPVPELTNDTNVVSSFPEGPFMKRRDTEATAKIDSGSSDDSQDGSDLSYQNLPGEITIAKLPQELQ